MSSNVNTSSYVPQPKSTAPMGTDTAPVREQVETVGEEIKELGRRGKEVAADELAAVREKGLEVAEQAQLRVNHWEQALTQSVRETPIRSLLYAAGAGLVFGFIVRR